MTAGALYPSPEARALQTARRQQCATFHLHRLRVGEKTQVGDFCYDPRSAQPALIEVGGSEITTQHHAHFRVTLNKPPREIAALRARVAELEDRLWSQRHHGQQAPHPA